MASNFLNPFGDQRVIEPLSTPPPHLPEGATATPISTLKELENIASMPSSPDPDKGFFNLGRQLKEEGLTFLEKNPEDPYQINIQDKAGNIRGLDVKRLMQDAGVPDSELSNTSIQYNTPDTSVETSPLSLAQRTKLPLQAPTETIRDLRRSFEDAVINPETGAMTVKKDGIWHDVDPSFLGKGNIYDKTKALVLHPIKSAYNLASDLPGDLAQLSGLAGAETFRFGAQSAGVAIGGAVGEIAGPPGAVAGAIYGAGKGREMGQKMLTSFGRAVGLLDTTPEELEKEAATEFWVGLGGEAFALGVKAVPEQWKRGAVNFATNASERAKNIVTSGMAHAFKKTEAVTKPLIEYPKIVLDKMNNALSAASGSISEARDAIAQKMLKVSENLLEQAPKELPKKFRQIFNKVLNSDQIQKLRFKSSEVADDFFKSFSDLGVIDVFTDHGDVNPLNYRFFSPEDKGQAMGKKAIVAVSENTKKLLDPIFRQIRTFQNNGLQKGQEAGMVLRDIEHDLNQVLSELNPETDKGAFAIITQAKANFKNLSAERWDKVGLKDQYNKISELYGNFSDSVWRAKGMGNANKGAEAFVKSLFSEGGANSTSKKVRNDLVELMGEKGQMMMRDIETHAAASAYIDNSSKFGIGKIAATIGGGIASHIPVVSNPLITVPFAVGANLGTRPRFVAKTVGNIAIGTRALLEGSKLLGSLGKRGINKLISDDQLFTELVRPIFTSGMLETQTRQQLLNSVGIRDNGQQ